MGQRFSAKLKLGNKAPTGTGVTSCTFGPNYGAKGHEVNAEWAASTPGLYLQMSIRNEIADQLEFGDEFTVTFEKDEKEVVPDGDSTA